MTISSTTTQTVTALGNGVTTNFTIGFTFQRNSHLRVYQQDESVTPFTRTLIEEGVGASKYTLSGGDPATGFDPATTVVMGTAPTATQRLIIKRVTPRTQVVDYDGSDPFPFADHEEQMDKQAMVVQELGADVLRSIRAPDTDDEDLDMVLPSASERAGLFLSFDEDGLPVVEDSGVADAQEARDDAEAAQAAAEAAQAAATASAAAAAAAAAGLGGLLTLTPGRALQSSAGQTVEVSAVTATELGHLSGVTSAIQTQLDGKQATGNYITALTGDVTASGPGSVAATIANDTVSNAKAANMATQTIKGRTTAGTGDPEDLTATQATAMLNAMVGDSGSGGVKGLVPAPASGDTAALKFLKADGTWATPGGTSPVAPTIQRFTSGSGTYTRPTSPTPLYLRVKMVGGGGGGGGSGTASGSAGGTGGDTTFGSNTASGGGGGGATGSQAGAGGGVSVGTGTTVASVVGSGGDGGSAQTGSNQTVAGGAGGSSFFGGAGKSGGYNQAAGAGATNSGGGGAGGGSNNVVGAAAGAGGGSGGYIEVIVTSPSGTYSYAVGAAGSAGSAGTSGLAGAAGGSGVIVVEEFYQ